MKFKTILLTILAILLLYPVKIFAIEKYQPPILQNTKFDTSKSLYTNSDVKKMKNIVIFIEFDGNESLTNHLDDAQSVENALKIYNSEDLFEMISNKKTVNVPSFKKYYERESYGKLSITSDIFPKQENKVVSYRDSHPIEYYLIYSENNKTGYKTPEEGLKRERELIEKAFLYVEEQIKQSVTNIDELDIDGDNNIDAIQFIVEKQELKDLYINFGDILWSHMRYNNPPIESFSLGKNIGSYNLITADDYTKQASLFSLNNGTYGTLIHEFGHTLGYIDLYRNNTSNTKPVGFFDIMGNLIGSNPQSFLSYFTSEYNRETAWHNPLPIIDKTTKSITLSKPQFNDPGESRAIKLQIGKSNLEYFIIEYHEKMDTFSSSCADQSGIIVYRVNDNYKYLGNTSSKDHIFIFRPDEKVLGESGGNLKNATLNMNRPLLGKKRTLNNEFDNESIYYSDGSNSGIIIEITSETEDSVTFNVNFPEINGEGTKESPYLIETVEDYLYLMTLETKGKYYMLLKDLDFSNISDYPKIDFEGNLDGNDKTLKNIKTTGTGVFNGVGIYNNHTMIKNLNIENITISPSRGDHLGGLAPATTNITLENIKIKSGTITNIRSDSNDVAATGGLIGSASSDTIINNCYANVEIYSPKNVGGLIGLNMNANIQNSFTQSTVNGEENIGSFIGIQYIMEDTYKIPSNAYYEKKTSIPSVGGYSSWHNLNALPSNSLEIGITGIATENSISMKVGESKNVTISSFPNKDLNYTITTLNSEKIKIDGHSIIAQEEGTAIIYTDIIIGYNTMRLTSNVNIQNSEDYIKGDVTMNGVVDLLDVMHALRISLNLIDIDNPKIITIGDFNKSGSIDLIDVMYILRIALNMEV